MEKRKEIVETLHAILAQTLMHYPPHKQIAANRKLSVEISEENGTELIVSMDGEQITIG